MELKDIEYFLAIAEEGNLVKAAERMYISQPAMSKFLSKLENEYGTKFFIRNHNHLKLTNFGLIFLDGAKKIMDIFRQTNMKIEDEKKDGNRTITIGVTGERSQRYLGKLFTELNNSVSNLHYHAIEAPVKELKQKLKDGEIDLAFYAVSERDEELCETVISDDYLVIAVPQGHRLYDKGSTKANDENMEKIDIKKLKDDSFVLLKKGTATRQIIDRYLAKEGLELNEIIETKGNYSSMLFVDNGIAIGFCYSHYNFNSNRIHYIGLKHCLMAPICVAYKKGTYLSIPMQKFLEVSIKRGAEY